MDILTLKVSSKICIPCSVECDEKTYMHTRLNEYDFLRRLLQYTHLHFKTLLLRKHC